MLVFGALLSLALPLPLPPVQEPTPSESTQSAEMQVPSTHSAAIALLATARAVNADACCEH